MQGKTIDEIVEYFKKLVSGEKLSGKIQLVRIWGAYQREAEKEQKCEEVREKINRSYKNVEVYMISDDMYIIGYCEDIFKDGTNKWYSSYFNGKLSNNLYNSYDKVLLDLVAMKTGNSDAVPYICRMLNMD